MISSQLIVNNDSERREDNVKNELIYQGYKRILWCSMGASEAQKRLVQVLQKNLETKMYGTKVR